MSPGRAGRHIELPADGGSLRAYRAGPPAGHGPGVLVVPGARLEDAIADACDRLAREGFVALAPDPWPAPGGEGEAPDAAAAGLRLDAAVAALVGDPGVDGARIGSLGFGPGGALALRAASRSPRLGAVVEVDGGLGALPLDAAKIEARVLAIFGEREAGADAERRELERALGAAGVRALVRVIPGVAAGFMHPSRPDRHDAGAAAGTWEMLLSFLRAELA